MPGVIDPENQRLFENKTQLVGLHSAELESPRAPIDVSVLRFISLLCGWRDWARWSRLRLIWIVDLVGTTRSVGCHVKAFRERMSISRSISIAACVA
jgi:hypothetical protein